ncbi:MAG TPA: hypothetical protein VLJ79_12350 [Candidatus Binatia bacterium]|nr:hypothetical protein [Candidatus Binatia bacterium]
MHNGIAVAQGSNWKLRGAFMSQPELKFEFDPPDFLQDQARSPQAPEKLNILKYLTAGGLLVAATVGIVSLFYGDVKNEMVMEALAKKKNPLAIATEETSTAIAEAKVLMAKLEERASSLTERVAALETNLYRSKAAALGFRNPSIRPISLAAQPPQQFVFNYPVKGENHLELKILQITNDSIVFEVTGTAPNSQVKAVKIAQPLKVGTSVELTQGIRMEGMPHIFMTVLEMPTKDTAIIAVGAKELAQS